MEKLPKPYYHDEDAGITIYHGDCRDILPHLPKVDLVLTDPPYGINKAEWDTSFPSWAIPLCVEKADCTWGRHYKWVIAGYNMNGMTYGAIGFGNWIPAVCAGKVKSKGRDAHSFVVGREPQEDHPDQKPLQFMRFLVNRLSESDDTILDPFMGSGTTLVAAKQLHRKAIGIEIEQRYCAIAVSRLQQGVLPI